MFLEITEDECYCFIVTYVLCSFITKQKFYQESLHYCKMFQTDFTQKFYWIWLNKKRFFHINCRFFLWIICICWSPIFIHVFFFPLEYIRIPHLLIQDLHLKSRQMNWSKCCNICEHYAALYNMKQLGLT